MRADLTKFTSTLDGKKPTFYRQAELYFNSMDDLKKGMATAGFKKVADDLDNFATGGLIGMMATASNAHETGSGEHTGRHRDGDLQDAQGHRRVREVLLGDPPAAGRRQQKEIGFERAELTKFTSNLDGSPAAGIARPSSISRPWTR